MKICFLWENVRKDDNFKKNNNLKKNNNSKLMVKMSKTSSKMKSQLCLPIFVALKHK